MTQTDDSASESLPTGSEDGQAQPKSDLDSLLKEFQSTANNTKELKPVIEFAKKKMADDLKETLDSDIASGVATIKKADDALKDVPDKLIEGLMEIHAKDNPSFVKAFEGRGSDPKAWEAALIEGSKSALALLSELPQNKVRDDLEAANAAVDGTSTDNTPSGGEPDLAEIQGLSDFDFKRRLEQEIAKAS